jgi:4-diphosphocytidyl-2-C-methyl-D-erythritol kinase
LDRSEEDQIIVRGSAAPTDPTNLAWRAVQEARTAAGVDTPLALHIDKRIPAQAGLGGASADAAGALIAASRLLNVPFDEVRTIAPRLGSDVPFALVGGTAVVAGRGELVSPRPPAAGYAMAIVVPPAELATVDVYQMWDTLDGPTGPAITTQQLPPSLRDYAPLGNDLYPAAVALAPAVDDWRAELAERWGVAVAMTGSGSGLFGLFATRGEAEEALAAVPVGARFAEVAEPVDRGWEEITDDEAMRG